MKSSLTLLVLFVLMLNMLAGCAPGGNQSKGTANQHDVVAGFWLGLWQGFIASFVFVVSLFKDNLCIYEVHNNGTWYNFGYLLGLACFFGGGGKRGSAAEMNPDSTWPGTTNQELQQFASTLLPRTSSARDTKVNLGFAPAQKPQRMADALGASSH